MDLIDKEALISQIERNFCNPCKEAGHDYNGVRCRACQYEDEIDDIDDAPTVDAVPLRELIELRDNLYENDDLTMRSLHEINFLIKHYSDGERKTDEQTN